MTTTDIDPVIATVFVAVPPERAWATFTTRIGEWWPAGTHSIGEDRVVDVVLEPALDGGIREIWADGVEHHLGPDHDVGAAGAPGLLVAADARHRPGADAGRGGVHVGRRRNGGAPDPHRLGGARRRARWSRRRGYVVGWPLVLERFVELGDRLRDSADAGP